MTPAHRWTAAAPRFTLILLCLLLVSGTLALHADNSNDLDLDDLFDAAEDIINDRDAAREPDDPADPDAARDPAEDAEPDLLSRFDDPDDIVVRGRVTATGGLGIGWKDYPDVSDLESGFRVSPEFNSKFQLSFDARPHSVLRLYGALSTEIDPEDRQYQFSDVQIDELFLDYTLRDTIFVRAGQHKMKWGQGRIFTPGNLLEDSEDGAAIRVSFSTLLDGVSLVTLAQEQFFPTDETQSWRHLAYAGQANLVVGPVLFTAGGRFQRDEGLRTLASAKTVIGRTDLFTDVVVGYEDEEYDLQTVSGFYREWNDLHLYGEHTYDGSGDRDNDHSLGLALARRRIFGTQFHLGAVWEHAFVDNSGTVVPGISWTPWRFVTARLGFPVVYGAEDSRYVLDNEDPYERRVAAIFQLQLSASF